MTYKTLTFLGFFVCHRFNCTERDLDWRGMDDTANNLTIQTLGNAQVLLGGQLVQWRAESARSLFFYLLSNPQGKCREEIIGALWNAKPDAKSGNRFRVAVYRAKAALKDRAAILEDHNRYRLAPRILASSDTHAFYAALKVTQSAATPDVARLQNVLDLYGGDYLPNEKADWATQARDEYRAAYVCAEVKLSLLHRAQGDCLASVVALTRALQTDPFIGENFHQKLMACLSVVEDKYAAIEHYRRFLMFLRQEVNDSPMPETVRLAERIKNGERICTCRHLALETPTVKGGQTKA